MDLDVVLARAAPADARGLLGGMGFGRRGDLPAGCPGLVVAIEPLGPDPIEFWSAGADVRYRQAGGFALAETGDLVFGTAELAQAGDLETLAREIYDTLFRTIADAGCRQLVRIHNYLPRITAAEAGTERYRLFNEGRHAAFAAAGRSTLAAPAATAVGIGGEALQISFLATSAEIETVENPRQVSAWAYPTRYGRSPTFSRATILRRGSGGLLFVSGTAGIVGHASLHPGDAAEQAREAWRNVQAILGVAAERRWRAGRPQALKIYVREAGDLAAVRGAIGAEPGMDAAMFLRAPLCRDELLVEMEAVFPLRPI